MVWNYGGLAVLLIGREGRSLLQKSGVRNEDCDWTGGFSDHVPLRICDVKWSQCGTVAYIVAV